MKAMLDALNVVYEEKEKRGFFKLNLISLAFTMAALAAPAFADDVAVRVGPVGAGATVGESHEYRDRDRDRTTVTKEREPADSKTVIKKEDDLGNREKTVIHHDRD